MRKYLNLWKREKKTRKIGKKRRWKSLLFHTGASFSLFFFFSTQKNTEEKREVITAGIFPLKNSSRPSSFYRIFFTRSIFFSSLFLFIFFFFFSGVYLRLFRRARSWNSNVHSPPSAINHSQDLRLRRLGAVCRGILSFYPGEMRSGRLEIRGELKKKAEKMCRRKMANKLEKFLSNLSWRISQISFTFN